MFCFGMCFKWIDTIDKRLWQMTYGMHRATLNKWLSAVEERIGAKIDIQSVLFGARTHYFYSIHIGSKF